MAGELRRRPPGTLLDFFLVLLIALFCSFLLDLVSISVSCCQSLVALLLASENRNTCSGFESERLSRFCLIVSHTPEGRTRSVPGRPLFTFELVALVFLCYVPKHSSALEVRCLFRHFLGAWLVCTQRPVCVVLSTYASPTDCVASCLCCLLLRSGPGRDSPDISGRTVHVQVCCGFDIAQCSAMHFRAPRAMLHV